VAGLAAGRRSTLVTVLAPRRGRPTLPPAGARCRRRPGPT
jgi:hypothetical protein